MGTTAVQLGAGRLKSTDEIDHKAGIRFHKKVGQEVKKGEPVFTTYTDKEDVLQNSLNRLAHVINIKPDSVSPPKMIIEFLDKSSL